MERPAVAWTREQNEIVFMTGFLISKKGLLHIHYTFVISQTPGEERSINTTVEG
jgi:hypothetical protein